MLAAWVGLGIAGLLAGNPTSLEQQLEQRLDWQAIDGCPSASSIAEATDRYLGRALANYPHAVIATARVEAAPSGYRLELALVVDGRHEGHELAGPDCDQLGRDVALLIASAVDPFALGPQAPPQRQLLQTPVVVQYPRKRTSPDASPRTVERSVPEPASEPTVAVPDDPVDQPEPRERRSTRPVVGTLAVAGTGFAGLFPQPSGGVVIEGGVERGLLRWQVGAAGWFGGSFRAGASEVGASLVAGSGSTGICVAPGRRRFEFAACAVAGVGAIVATSVNTQTSITSPRPWGFLGPDLRATWIPRERFGVYLGVSVLPALARPGWSVTNPDATFRIPPVVGLLRFGLELRDLGRSGSRDFSNTDLRALGQ